MSYFVYILKSRERDWFYIGMSEDVEKRFNHHNKGFVRTTKGYKPFDLLLVEEFPDRKSARFREKYYKTGFGRKVWMKKLEQKGYSFKNSPEGE